MRKIGIVLLVAVITGCNKGPSPEEQLTEDINIIEEYVDEKGWDATKTASGLHYVVDVEGTGNKPSADDDVKVRYKGYFTDDKVFDESDNAGITFNLQQVIQGWTEGIPKFKEGGKGKLLIPSALAYGEEGNSSVPPNTVLIFDVELLEIIN